MLRKEKREKPGKHFFLTLRISTKNPFVALRSLCAGKVQKNDDKFSVEPVIIFYNDFNIFKDQKKTLDEISLDFTRERSILP